LALLTRFTAPILALCTRAISVCSSEAVLKKSSKCMAGIDGWVRNEGGREGRGREGGREGRKENESAAEHPCVPTSY
jgi:hypothetical protein